MKQPLKLMVIGAHPDDETLGMGGILAKYAAEGIETYVVTATRGQRGWFGPAADYPGPQQLGMIRENELCNAAWVLGVKDVMVLDFMDGDLDLPESAMIIRELAAHIRWVRPDVVVTFDPFGAYGHPDHIAISQYTQAALIEAARVDEIAPAHQVAKLYYMAFTQEDIAAYESVMGELVMHIDGVERRSAAWPEWAITTHIDAGDYWQTVWEAVQCHESQLPGYAVLQNLTEAQHRQLWGKQTFYRAYSLVNNGRAIEHDLFDGLG